MDQLASTISAKRWMGRLDDDFFLSRKRSEYEASSDVATLCNDAQTSLGIVWNREVRRCLLSLFRGENSLQNFRAATFPITHNGTAFIINNNATGLHVGAIRFSNLSTILVKNDGRVTRSYDDMAGAVQRDVKGRPVTRHYTSLRRPDSAQIRHDVGTVRLNGNLQGSDPVATTQGVRSTRMSSARGGCWHLSLAVRSAPWSTST